MACLRTVEASKPIGLLAGRDSNGRLHTPFVEHRKSAESEKRERLRPDQPVDLKRTFAMRESTDSTRTEQATNPARSDARAAPIGWAWQLMVGHEQCSSATRTHGMILQRRVNGLRGGTQLASKGPSAESLSLAFDATAEA